MTIVETVIVGAGPAGLACAASLRQRRLSCLVLEQASQVGASWRRHYDRLHLHTHRKHSALPGYPMPDRYPRYPSRLQVIEYLEAYAKYHAIDVAFRERVTNLQKNDSWRIETSSGTLQANNVVIASGFARLPIRPVWKGQEHYAGKILHSCDFANAEALGVEHVLVVEFGNSAGEIAVDSTSCRQDTFDKSAWKHKILQRQLTSSAFWLKAARRQTRRIRLQKHTLYPELAE
jgi:cation diffusion facilitator CzcD-associated flavoprotein CzcO